ncbi:pectate lyase-like adhesive domain-containing protein [Enterococcus sp. UD-01]|jgi:hypothetical protein|uniref:pectate lyase-like adhesive domain-containing protein n=1 Tax=Enterococcus sp. UD-01 TaxID=3373911 RepID=UPI0038369DA0
MKKRKKRVKGNKWSLVAVGVGVLLLLVLVYQGYWFIRDFGKNKYAVTVEDYVQPEIKEKIGILLDVQVDEPKEETLLLKSKSKQTITPEALEAVKVAGMSVVSEAESTSDGVKIKIKPTSKNMTLKIPVPLAKDTKDKIEIYRDGRKIKTTAVNYKVPQTKKQKNTNTALSSANKLYATTGAVKSGAANYDMFRLPMVSLIASVTTSNKKVVYNGQELIAAIKDTSVDEIEFGANISINTSGLPKINRSLTIDGKNFELSTNWTSNSLSVFILEKTKTLNTFIFKNMKLSLKSPAGVIKSDDLYSNDNNWLISIENVSSINVPGTSVGYTRNGSLVNAPRASLMLTGEINWKSDNRDYAPKEAILIDATEVLVTDGAKINMEGTSTVFRLYPRDNSINTTFVVEKGSVLNIHSVLKQAIYANVEGSQNRVYFEARDENTVINATSRGEEVGAVGATISLCGVSDNRTEATKSYTKVSSGAKLNVHSLGLVGSDKGQPAMINQVKDSQFYVDGEGSELNLISNGEANNIGATLRFRLVGGQTFTLKNKGKVTITKKNGEASAVRMYGTNNNFYVQSGGNLNIRNGVNSYNPSDGADTGGKQGIQFPVDGSGTSIFSLEDKGSEVYIKAMSGPALWTQSGNLHFLIGKDTIFRAEGQTRTQQKGIVQSAGKADFEIDQPRFYDLRNNRPNGGQVFSTGSSSGTFEAKKSYLSLWEIKNKVNLDKDPDVYWAPISYKLTGTNFEKIVSTDFPNEFNTSTYKGADKYARISGNSSKPVVDELRVPTNADKKIYGHVSVKVGYGEELRDAWETEVWVTVRIKRDGKTITEKVVPTKGINNNLPGVQQWDEEQARGGIFVLETSDFLRTGDVVEVVGANRGRKEEAGETEKETILVKPVTTVDVTPPLKMTVKKDELSSAKDKITNATKQIKGTIDMYDERDDKLLDEVYIVAKIDNQFAKDAILKVTSDGKTKDDSVVDWTLNLPRYIQANETIEIYAKDVSDIGNLQDKNQLVTHSQEPNQQWGNLMPTAIDYDEYKGYHDAVQSSGKDERFKPAVLLTVEDIVPEGLKIMSESVTSSTKVTDPKTNMTVDVTRIGSRLTYTGKIRSADSDPDSKKIIKAVMAQVTIPEELNADALTYSFKKKKITDSEDKASELKVEYDEVSRILSNEKGKVNLRVDDEIIFTFSSTVANTSEGVSTFDTVVKVQGLSTDEEPFVAGDFIPENQRILTAEVAMRNPMPKNDDKDSDEPDPVIEDGNAYVRLAVVNKRLTVYHRNVNKIDIKIDGDLYKTYTMPLATAEKSFLVDMPLDQHRRNITADYYYPDPNGSGNMLKGVATWNKGKWDPEVNEALNE